VVVLDAPLLFEAKISWLTRPIVVVSCDEESQVRNPFMLAEIEQAFPGLTASSRLGRQAADPSLQPDRDF
jgi:hypothetical protein